MRLRYVGARDRAGKPTQWLPGIPARDLNEATVARLGDERVAQALASGLYEADGPRRTRKAAAVVDAEPAVVEPAVDEATGDDAEAAAEPAGEES